LFNELRTQIEHLKARKQNLIDDGGLVRHMSKWTIKRIEHPPYVVLIQLQEFGILIEHDFRLSAIHTHGDIESTIVDFRCDQQEEVYLSIDGSCVTVEGVARLILEPIVSGKKL